MPGQGRLGHLRPRFCSPLVFAGWIVLLSAPPAVGDVPRPMLEDAELADVTFVDAHHGWAVGDRGVIWATEDGGRQWRLQQSGVECRLETVFFLDANIGWAAGGVTQPYSHTTRGVLLRTRDGGRTWSEETRAALPYIRRLKFFSPGNGVAIGAPSALFPTGVAHTSEGGRSWTALPGVMASGWQTGDFASEDLGAVAGAAGALATVRNRQLQAANTPPTGLRTLRDMQLTGPRGWLVGDGGLVLQTGDMGHSWQMPPAEFPADEDHFNLHAVAMHGPHVWLAGSPGTRVWHSADAGRSWQEFSTGQSVPIQALAFADEQLGWAVGALGTILATADGGRTWQVQHAGGSRAALLGLFSRAGDVPLELFAELAGNEGYLAAVSVLGREDALPGGDLDRTAPQRLHEALVGVGASSGERAWRFPLTKPELDLSAERTVALWNRANDGEAVQRMEAAVVRQIRLWRPDVIVTHCASPQGDNPLGHLVNQIVLGAVEAAADPTAYSEQLTRAGLEPWQAKKVFGLLPAGQIGPVMLTTSQLAPRLGRSLADYAARHRGLLDDEFSMPPEAYGFRLYIDHLPQGSGQRDFFSGIQLEHGGVARRRELQPAAQTLAMMRRVAQKHRNVNAILNRSEDGNLSTQLAGQVGDLVADLDEQTAGQVLFHLAKRHFAAGNGELAAETFELLARSHPKHPLAEAAIIWLVQYYSSDEIGWRLQHRQQVRESAGVGLARPLQPQKAEAGKIIKPQSLPISATTARGVAIEEEGGTANTKRAIEWAGLLQRNDPALFGDPRVRFPLAIAFRRQGLPREAERFYLAEQRSRTHDAWWASAECENWLRIRHERPPKPAWACRRAAMKPRLDGRLDDGCWQQVPAVELHSPLGDGRDWPAAVRLTYDDEFLYLAAECSKAPNVAYPTTDRPRQRDADLSDRDRVEFYFDLDRDWCTWFRLVIDHRGWAAEECWGDRTFDPTWFIAAAEDERRWTIEAALPLEHLTGRFPTPGKAWAVGVQRVVPGAGFQSWTTPASVEVQPQGFGLLLFE